MFQETAVASAALQRKDVHLAVSHTLVEGVLKRLQELRTESEFKVVFEKAKERAEAAGIEFPDKIPGESRPRKIPARYKYSSKSTGEDHHPENLEEFYRTRVYYTFVDTITQEMLRRFKGKDNSSTGIILKGLHSLTVASNWSKGVEPGDAELVRTVSKFYGIEEEKVFTELKVFHASYSFTKNNVQEMLKCLKDNEIESVFPSLSELLKIYATLPVSTSTVERSFSKLKLVKSSLRSLCNEERLSDLLLLSTERDIPINREEVIHIFKKTTERILL